MFSLTDHVREQSVALKHHADVAVPGGNVGDVAVADADVTRSRLEIAGDQVEQRRLAGARGAEQRQEFARRDVQRRRLQRVEFSIAH